MSFLILKKNTVFFPTTGMRWNCAFLILASFLFYSSAQAQPCIIPIINNTIELKPATCINTIATLQGSTTLGGNGTYTYQWQRSPGNCGNGNFVNIPSATAKDYPVPSGTDPNDCFRRVVTSGTCTSNSNTERVAINDRTTPAVPATTVVNSTCVTATGSITVTSPAPGAGISYSIDGVNYSNTTGVFSSLAPGTYSVTAKYPAGCISPVKTTIVNSTPAINGTISPATATFCAGGSRTLTVSGGGTSYQWYRNDIPIAGATASSYNATTSGTYTADIIVGTCSAKASNNSVVTVIPLPTGSLSPSSGTLCASSSILLTTSGGTSYQWFQNGNPINNATSATYSVSSPGTYTVRITSGGCSNMASNAAVITQGPAPSGFISPAGGVLCPGGQVALTVTTASGVNTYLWFRDGQLISNATGATYNATQPGNYSVFIFNGTCSGPATNIASVTQSSPITFTTASTNPSCASPTGSIAISAVTGGGSSNYSYSKDNGVVYQAAATFNNLSGGTYQVVVKDTAGCISNARTVVIQSFTSTLAATANTTNARCGAPNGSAIIQATGGTSPYSYKLDSGSYQTSNSFGNLTVGSHNVTVRDAPGCLVNVAFVITQGVANPNLVIINPPVICPGYSTSLLVAAIKAGSDTGLVYTYWRDTTAITPLTNPGAVTAGTYYVKATNVAGCFTIKPVTVTLQLTCVAEPSVFVPTAFTPNKNSANDILRPVFYNVIELRYFKVYNRWGQEVYKTASVGKGWDGTIKGSQQPADSYSWILECIGKNGEIIKQSGRTLLIR